MHPIFNFIRLRFKLLLHLFHSFNQTFLEIFMIVITTPTEQIGQQILARILDKGKPIRVIVREPSRLDPKIRDRVEVVQGSHDNIAVLTKAFAGADCVFWLVPPNPHTNSPTEHYLKFTRPACEAFVSQGVKRVVFVTSLGYGFGQNAGLLTAAFIEPIWDLFIC